MFSSQSETRLLLVTEHSVVDFWRQRHPEWPWRRLQWLADPSEVIEPGQIGIVDLGISDLATTDLGALDPNTSNLDTTGLTMVPGVPSTAGAASALRAIQAASTWALSAVVDGIVTAPVSKIAIAKAIDPTFRGHTDYLAQAAGLEGYGQDYLMAFLAEDLNVVLHSVHLPLRQAFDSITTDSIVRGLRCLDRHRPKSRIAVAGVNPHAGEQGLLGLEDQEIVAPAVQQATQLGINVSGPHSPDSLFARARSGEFDWVYALYHDQGLIAVKTIGFGNATNWTLGLPYVRVSVDHGTAYDIAGKGVADFAPMQRALATATQLLEERK